MKDEKNINEEDIIVATINTLQKINSSQLRQNYLLLEQENIIFNNDPEAAYNFALNNKDINIDLLQQIIINSGNLEYIYLFARNIKGMNINELQEAIINNGNAKCIYRFARNIKGADINRLQEFIWQ